jgi:hypothetical protein
MHTRKGHNILRVSDAHVRGGGGTEAQYAVISYSLGNDDFGDGFQECDSLQFG